MKAARPPIHYPGGTLGPWGVDSYGRTWYVVHAQTLRARAIGPVELKGKNYFDAAMGEARRRNQEAA